MSQENGGNLISKVSDIQVGDEINIRVTDGSVNAKVESLGG